MNQALVQDVVAEVMKRLGNPGAGGGNGAGGAGVGYQTTYRAGRGGVRAGEDAPANEGKAREHHGVSVPINQHGVFDNVDRAVDAATEAQKKLVKLSLDERDQIVKLVKQMAKDNAQSWGKIELDETKIGRLDHKIEKLQILELVPGVEFLKTQADSGSNGLCLHEYAPFGVIGIITPVTHVIPTLSANVVNMTAPGTSIAPTPPPSGANCAAMAVREYTRAIAQKFEIDPLTPCIPPP